MKRLVAFMMCAVSLGAAAQSTITYPYNPDGNADALIGATDLQDMLSTYGGSFSPSEIQIDGVGLLQVIQDLQSQLNALQTIDVNAVESTLTALQEEVDALEAENAALAQQVQDLQNAGFLTEETDPVASASGYATQTWVEDQGYSTGSGIEGLENYLSVDEENHTVLISGANLQVVSGEGYTDAPVNGTGNVIIGYDDEAFSGSDKSGSHNLVVGDAHTYSSYGGIVVGYNNSITGYYSSVSGGASNTASGYYSSVSGGGGNTASGYRSSVSGGYDNTALGDFSSVSGGEAIQLRDIGLPSRGDRLTPLRESFLPFRGDSLTPLRDLGLPSWGEGITPLWETFLPSWGDRLTPLRESFLPFRGERVTPLLEKSLPSRGDRITSLMNFFLPSWGEGITPLWETFLPSWGG